jgi:hypothetical protein
MNCRRPRASDARRRSLLRAACAAALLAGTALANPVEHRLHTPKSLSIAPEAVSVALAGAMAGSGPGLAAACYNPAALAGLDRIEAAGSGGPWQTGLHANRDDGSDWAGFAVPVREWLAVGIDAAIARRDEWVVTNDSGHFWGFLVVRDLAVGARAAAKLGEHWAAGVGARMFSSNAPEESPYWDWWRFPIRASTTTLLADAGVHWRPKNTLGFGLSLCNAGPDIAYADAAHADLGLLTRAPWTLRLGGCWQLPELGPMRARLLAQAGVPLVPQRFGGPPDDVAAFARRMAGAVAAEATMWNTVSLRIGYVADQSADRYGITAGLGVRVFDLVSIDLATDAPTYRYASRDWRLSVALTDIAGFWRED